MRTREEIEKDMDALFIGGYRDRQITFTELRHITTMLGKYRKELDELDALEESLKIKKTTSCTKCKAYKHEQ